MLPVRDRPAMRHDELIGNLVDHVTAATPNRKRQEFGMIGALARKFFGSPNDRRIKGYQSRVDAINALEPEIAALSDDALKARTAEFRQAARRRQDPRRTSGSGLRHGARGGQAHARPAAFRRPADRRHGAARRRHRRDEDRRRQDAGRDAGGLSQCAGRQGRPCRHRQRLSRPPRLRMDGTDLQFPRPDHRRHRPRPRRPSARKPMRATSPTAPTTNTASTICATT
jgi:hypothetical protein